MVNQVLYACYSHRSKITWALIDPHQVADLVSGVFPLLDSGLLLFILHVLHLASPHTYSYIVTG